MVRASTPADAAEMAAVGVAADQRRATPIMMSVILIAAIILLAAMIVVFFVHDARARSAEARNDPGPDTNLITVRPTPAVDASISTGAAGESGGDAGSDGDGD